MNYIAVGISGCLGAITRALLMKSITYRPFHGLPLNTILINITGCFILSFFLEVTLTKFKISAALRTGISTGFLGAYTTFSTFALESVNLVLANQTLTAVAYILLTVGGCLLAAELGKSLSKSFREANPS